MKTTFKTRKAQSAMEYLMTYGWAILIIAVVLGALFSLGVFSSSNLLGTSCIAYSGFTCTSPLLHSSSFTATVGQATGTTWTAANILLVGYGAGTPAAAAFAVAGCSDPFTNGITSGQTVNVIMTSYASTTTGCTSLSTSYGSVGSAFAGSLWAFYTASGTAGLTTQLANLNVKAS